MIQNDSILLEPIPAYARMPEVLRLVQSGSIDFRYLDVLKRLGKFKDDLLSGWLNINVKTFRSYKNGRVAISPDIQEHTVMLLSLIKHGHEVFGNADAFAQWLKTENFHLDGSRPSDYLNTISGIKFIDDHISGIAFGDNA
ncbi:MAG: MbcA/ParS/Xre antitoxin family protein [Bacteroidota bacterium]|nr:MbcA/ParS/Xre antitoxin family protein [Bacteroidota bacterium]